MKKEDDIWKTIANTYLQEYALHLKQEYTASKETAPSPTPHLDWRVQSYVRKQKHLHRLRNWGSLAAACLVISIIAPSALKNWDRGGTTELISSSSTFSEAASGGSSETTSSAPSSEILPLSFSLPENFSVAGVEQDMEKTVYFLENTQLDPVVITLEQQGDPALFDSLTPLTLEGQEVYAQSDSGFQLLTFEKSGIFYQLTCQYDINTLTDLSRNILISKQ